MATGSSYNEKLSCGLCKTSISKALYRAHVAECGTKKTCALCGREVDSLTEHYERCSGGNNSINSMYRSQQTSAVPRTSINPTTYTPRQQNTKECPFCSMMVQEDNYTNHLDLCSAGSSTTPSTKRMSTKHCVNCDKDIDETMYPDHIENCFNPNPTSHTPKRKITRKCTICFSLVEEDDYNSHLNICNKRQSSAAASIHRMNMKMCINCSRDFDEIEYIKHIENCCEPLTKKRNNTKDCIICSRPIPELEFEKHVHECLSKSSSSYVTQKPKITYAQKTCFKCSKPVNLSKTSSHNMPCRSQHIYCLKCLQESMNEHIQSKTAPVCHTNVCDYELSRHDVSCLPLDENIIQELLDFVKNTQRPQCPVCQFYVDFKTMDDLQRHVFSCPSESMIPCEYCHCLYNMERLDAHTRQCRNLSRAQQQQALIDFLLLRTKYPITEPQMRMFIEYRKKNRLAFDPHSIVDALVEFGAVFPLEVPTRDCEVCLEAKVYDDVFVFGCDESHKLCYGCFEDACVAKMNSNEVLTCGLCTYQLLDGEIKQLRVSDDRKRQFLDYQAQKTFSIYRDGTQGVIKCPNQRCKWIAEARNPTDRFSVTCKICDFQFCSLCSQQYHYRTTCQQLREITQRWVIWCNTERGTYLQARAQQDANFRAQLEDYERQRAANEQRNAELRQRYDELIADENYKGQNCRLCPNCQRVVQHLGGCDSMICGQNYHGGDQQSGCGRRFNWSQARPYMPIANNGVQQVRNDLPRPEEQQAIVHKDIRCDSCHQEVQGIRFDCCHCASLIFCEKCEQRATLEHANQIRDEHKQQHVFQIIPRPLHRNTE